MGIRNRQLPFVGLDDFKAWTAGDLAVVNKVPDEDSTGAPKAGPFSFVLMNTTGAGTVDTSTIDVWFKKSATDVYEQIIDDGVFQGSWTGTIVNVGGSGDVRVTFTPPFTVASEAVASIRVVADTTTTGDDIDVTYSFTTEDHAEPQITAAVGWWPTKVRVTFDDDMASSAEDEDNYSIEPYQPGNRAAVTPTITGVTELSSTEYELETNWELTPGAEYTVTAAVVIQDTDGNGMDVSANSAQFTAYDYRDTGRLFDGWKIYQQLAAYDRKRDMSGDLEKFSEVRQNAVDLALKHIDDLRDLTDPDWCSATYLEALLYDNGNPLTFITDETLKRRIAWRCKELNKKRGTAPGIILAVQLVTGLTCAHVTDRSRRWRIDYRMSDVEDTVNELYLDYEAHRILTTGGVHGMADGTNIVSSSLYPASGDAEVIALVNGIVTAYEAHRILSGVHGAADSTNQVYRPAATTIVAAVDRLGEARRKYEAHRMLTAGSVHGAADTTNDVTSEAGDFLDFDTLLGGGAAQPFDFWLEFTQALTSDQRTLVGQCAAAMKAKNSHYKGTIEP